MRPTRGSGRHNRPGEPSSSSGNRVEVVKACTRSNGMALAPSVFVGVDFQLLSGFIQVCVKMAAEPRIPRTGLRRMDNAARRRRADALLAALLTAGGEQWSHLALGDR